MKSPVIASDVIKESAKISMAQIKTIAEQRALFEAIGKQVIAKIQVHVDKHAATMGSFDLGPMNDLVAASIQDLKNNILEEGYKMSKDTAAASGAMEGITIVLNSIESLEKEALLNTEMESRQKELAEKMKNNSFDEDAPRKVGTRPESLKDIRGAKQYTADLEKSTEDPSQ